MVESAHAAPESLRAHFAKKAVLPEKQIAKAEGFLRALENQPAPPDPNTLQTGRKLLQTLEDKTELYLFNAAVLAGQEAATEADLESRLDSINQGLSQAQLTSERLRRTLESFS